MENFYEKRVAYTEKVLKMVLAKCGDKVDELELLVKKMDASEGKATATELIELIDMLIVAYQDCETAKNLLKEEVQR